MTKCRRQLFRRCQVVAVSLLFGALFAGCSTASNEVATRDKIAEPTNPVTAPAPSYPVGIADIDPPINKEIRLRTTPTVSEDGPGGCRGSLTTTVTESPDSIDVALTITSDAVPPFDGCTLEPRSVTVTLDEMPDELRLTDSLGGTFTYIEGRLEQCPGGPQICNNDPASCDNATLHDAIANSDVPARFRMLTTRCEEPFAVVDVDYGAGACGQSGEAELDPCSGQRIHRMYWWITDESWGLIGYDDGVGCGTLLAVAPDFPSTLCADLPAIA